MAETTEKISHGEPTFFVLGVCSVCEQPSQRRAYRGVDTCSTGATGSADQGFTRDILQTALCWRVFGVRGWVGIELDCMGDEELSHIHEAWRRVAPKRLKRAGQARFMGFEQLPPLEVLVELTRKTEMASTAEFLF
jgi:hypothetical protein